MSLSRLITPSERGPGMPTWRVVGLFLALKAAFVAGFFVGIYW